MTTMVIISAAALIGMLADLKFGYMAGYARGHKEGYEEGRYNPVYPAGALNAEARRLIEETLPLLNALLRHISIIHNARYRTRVGLSFAYNVLRDLSEGRISAREAIEKIDGESDGIEGVRR